MNTLDIVKAHLLGSLQVGDYIAAFIFCSLGLFISLWARLRKRNRNSDSTPVHFSWSFFLLDNGSKILVTLIVQYLLFRFCGSIIKSELSMEYALAFGFLLSIGLERTIQWAMNRFETICNLLGMDREAYMQKVEQKAQVELENRDKL